MLGIHLDRINDLPLWRQIYQHIKELIHSGQLMAGDALPSTRELARELMVSRNTVCEAYDQLISEGYIINRLGAPSRVREGLCMEPAEAGVLLKEKIFIPNPISISFQTGRPDLLQFPIFLWQQLMRRAFDLVPLEAYGYNGPEGLLDLRQEIAAWLFRSRGLKVLWSDIFITDGATHGLHLLANMLCSQGQEILIEDPCHNGMLTTFQNKGCNITHIPVDSEGIQTAFLPVSQNIGAVYVTPSHQFPLGGILSAARRTSLIRYARENNLYIIEDDYDSEFRYNKESIAPLYSMDSLHVIYVGTFSKSIFPALRIGFVILPHHLHKKWCNLRTHTDVQNPIFEQVALSEFLKSRKFDRHVKRMRKIYGQRRQVLLETLEEIFGNEWVPYGDSAGLHVVIEFPGKHFDKAFQRHCLQAGLYITPVEHHCIEKGHHHSKLLIGYGHLEPDEIRKGILLLSKCMQQFDL